MKMLNVVVASGLIIALAVGARQGTTAASAAAPSASEKVLYESDHIRYVEVTNRPGVNRLPAVPYPSVLMVDAAWPELTEAPSGQVSDPVLPPDNRPYPWCRSQGPLPERTVTVTGAFPQHYYRLDYKRIDGKDYGANALRDHADVLGPPARTAPDPRTTLKDGKPHSADWPYDIGYSAVTAAPANHTVRFEDDHIQVIEVAIRDGETENMHGHPYPSVYSDDGGMFPAGAVYRNARLIPGTKPPFGAFSKPPAGADFPVCASAVPESPHAVKVEKGPPQHFYRVHFKRVDGDTIRTAQAGSAEQALLALERQRLAALRAADTATLQGLLSDDYVHVHANGQVDDREAFFKGVVGRPRESLRGELRVRTYGDLAVITGEQTNIFAATNAAAASTTRNFVTQVAHRERGRWRLVVMQSTPIRDAAQVPSANVSSYPAAPAANLSAAQREIVALEERRAAAIAGKEFTALAGLLADDYLHVYGGGTSSDRAGYIEQVRRAPRVPTRGPLKVRVYGDSAVVTGNLLNRINYPEGERLLDTFVTQVLHKANGEWKFVSFQITPKSAPTP